MAVLRTLLCLAATATLIQLAMAANHTVGGPTGGWDTSTDLQTWVASEKFVVGDNLIFQYTPNHDVLEVSKADYDSCQTSSPINSYNDGNTVITLSSPGKRYFICGTLGHCSQGMQTEIDTLATAAAPSTPPAVPPATSPSTPSSSPAPKTSPSPAKSPESAPASSSSPDVPSTESPGTSPPSGISPSSPPSSANGNSFQTCLTLGSGLVLMVLLAL